MKLKAACAGLLGLGAIALVCCPLPGTGVRTILVKRQESPKSDFQHVVIPKVLGTPCTAALTEDGSLLAVASARDPSPDGEITGFDAPGALTLWHPGIGHPVSCIKTRGYQIDLEVSPNARLLAAIGHAPPPAAPTPYGNPLVLRLWDVHSGKLLQTWPHCYYHYGSGLAFSPDGSLLATGDSATRLENGQSVTLYDVAQGRRLRDLTGFQWGGVEFISFSSDGALIAATTSPGDAVVPEFAVWRVRDGHLILHFGQDDGPAEGRPYFLPDNKRIIVGDSMVDLSSRKHDWTPVVSDSHACCVGPYRANKNLYLFQIQPDPPVDDERPAVYELWNVVSRQRVRRWQAPPSVDTLSDYQPGQNAFVLARRREQNVLVWNLNAAAPQMGVHGKL